MLLTKSLTKERLKIASASCWATYKNPGQSNLKTNESVSKKSKDKIVEGFENDDFSFREAIIDREDSEFIPDFSHREAIVATEDSDFERRRQNLHDTLANSGRTLLHSTPFYKGVKTPEPQIVGQITVTNNEIIIAFRGTIIDKAHSNPYGEAYSDLNYGLSKMTFGQNPPIDVHSGFKAQYQACQTNLNEILREMYTKYPQSKDFPIVMTGHSLGGALAQIAALDFACQEEHAGREIMCIPLAIPSPFKDPTFYNSKLHDTTLCIQNEDDIVLNASKLVYKPVSVGYRVAISAKVANSHGEEAHAKIVDQLTHPDAPAISQNSLLQDSSASIGLWRQIRNFFSKKEKTKVASSQKAIPSEKNPNGIELQTWHNSTMPKQNIASLQREIHMRQRNSQEVDEQFAQLGDRASYSLDSSNAVQGEGRNYNKDGEEQVRFEHK